MAGSNRGAHRRRQTHAVEEIPERPRHAGGFASVAHVSDIAGAIRCGEATIVRRAQRTEFTEQNAAAIDAIAIGPCRHAGEIAFDETPIRPGVEYCFSTRSMVAGDCVFLSPRCRAVGCKAATTAACVRSREPAAEGHGTALRCGTSARRSSTGHPDENHIGS